MKFNFLFELLGGVGSRISSKRSVMVFFVLLFAFCLIVNIYTGKSPSETFQMQLFELTAGSIVIVFGEGILRVMALLRGKKLDPPADPPAEK